MNTSKSFCSIPALHNNTPGQVAPIGELSHLGFTFVKETRLFTNSNYPGLALTDFHYVDNNVVGPLPDPIAASQLMVLSWMYTQARNGVFTSNIDTFLSAFMTEFADSYVMRSAGEMVQFGTNRYLPTFVDFFPKAATVDTSWKVWLSDSAFTNQFDIYTNTAVDIVDEPDVFFNNYNIVSVAVNAGMLTRTTRRVRELAAGAPYTVLRGDAFTWVDPSGSGETLEVPMPVIVWGQAGDNLDNAKEAIIEWILGNTSHTRAEWAEIFPDLFSSTEFIIIPGFDQYAVPPGTRSDGTFRSALDLPYSQLLAQRLAKGTGYTPSLSVSRGTFIPTLHNGVSAVVVAGPENRDGLKTFTERFPDYLNVPLDQIDAGLMSEDTLEFVMELSEALKEAEKLTPMTGVPPGYNRVERDGVVYLGKSILNFLMLVATKYSVDELMG